MIIHAYCNELLLLLRVHINQMRLHDCKTWWVHKRCTWLNLRHVERSTIHFGIQFHIFLHSWRSALGHKLKNFGILLLRGCSHVKYFPVQRRKRKWVKVGDPYILVNAWIHRFADVSYTSIYTLSRAHTKHVTCCKGRVSICENALFGRNSAYSGCSSRFVQEMNLVCDHQTVLKSVLSPTKIIKSSRALII